MLSQFWLMEYRFYTHARGDPSAFLNILLATSFLWQFLHKKCDFRPKMRVSEVQNMTWVWWQRVFRACETVNMCMGGVVGKFGGVGGHLVGLWGSERSPQTHDRPYVVCEYWWKRDKKRQCAPPHLPSWCQGGPKPPCSLRDRPEECGECRGHRKHKILVVMTPKMVFEGVFDDLCTELGSVVM